MSNLSDKSKKGLNDLAKNLGLKNYSKFSKDELVKAISNAQKNDSTKTTKIKPDNSEAKVSEERITRKDLQDIQDTKTDMTDESADEMNDPMNPAELNKNEVEIATVNSEKHKKFLDENVVSEGHSKEKVSFETM